jgi:hypothetical protein
MPRKRRYRELSPVEQVVKTRKYLQFRWKLPWASKTPFCEWVRFQMQEIAARVTVEEMENAAPKTAVAMERYMASITAGAVHIRQEVEVFEAPVCNLKVASGEWYLSKDEV